MWYVLSKGLQKKNATMRHYTVFSRKFSYCAFTFLCNAVCLRQQNGVKIDGVSEYSTCTTCLTCYCRVIRVAFLSAKCVADIYDTLMLE